jgi:hypothetical protein
VRGAKKKKDRSGRKVSATGGGDPSEALRNTKDITLKETGPFVLLEYSVRWPYVRSMFPSTDHSAEQEEHPPVLNNFGMGSILVNYYRKLSDDDEHVPNVVPNLTVLVNLCCLQTAFSWTLVNLSY